MIYFDNAATTYPKPQCVYDAITKGMKEYSFNAGRGSYRFAEETFKMINQTRDKLAKIIDAKMNDVIFTSSATESLNNILNGLELSENDYVYISCFEHNAIVRTLHKLKVKVKLIPFDKETWQLDTESFLNMLVLYPPKAVVISQISNVTGFELPYDTIFEYVKQYSAITILDAAQGFGIYPIKSNNLNFVVFAGHKSLYGPFGIAGYIIKQLPTHYIAFKTGGTGSDSLNLDMPDNSPLKYEAGSLNSSGIYAINQSIDYLQANNCLEKSFSLTKYLIESLQQLDNVIIYLPKNYISKNIVSINIEGYTSEEVGVILASDFDICLRTGYHCAPLIHDFIDSKKFLGTVRISLGLFNNKNEIDQFVSILKDF